MDRMKTPILSTILSASNPRGSKLSTTMDIMDRIKLDYMYVRNICG